MVAGQTASDGGDEEDGLRLGQRVVAGVIRKRAFVACLCVTASRQTQRLARVNVAFDDEVGVGQNRFQFGQNFSRLARPNAVNAAAGTGHHVLRSLDGDALAKNGVEDFHFRIA